MIRRGGPHDVPFLRDMLHHAYYWRENAPEMEDLPVSRYILGWGRRGDAAVIAIEDAWPVGAAWYRLFTANEPGYGFVDEETPELSIAVVPSKRGRGHGFMLLKALMQRAREDGFARLSLSVEPDNPSIALYEKFGFRKVGERNGATTMVADLEDAPN
jgi:ribosomal protein S18 acetylase RimI-like enzyme